MKALVFTGLLLAQTATASPYTLLYGDWQQKAEGPQSFNLQGALQRSHYLNQPEFSADGKTLLFTEQTGLKPLETDIFSLELANAAKVAPKPLRQTAFGEFSATPYQQGYSVVRVEADGTQRLWWLSATAEKLLLPEVVGVGYHVWGKQDDLMLFLLADDTQPHRVVYRDNTGNMRLLNANPGRSFVYDAQQDWFYFTAPKADAAPESALQLWRYRAGAAKAEWVAALPDAGKDLALTPQGALVVSAKQQLWHWQQGQWQLWLDASKYCEGVVTRFKFNLTNQQLALVCEEVKS